MTKLGKVPVRDTKNPFVVTIDENKKLKSVEGFFTATPPPFEEGDMWYMPDYFDPGPEFWLGKIDGDSPPELTPQKGAVLQAAYWQYDPWNFANAFYEMGRFIKYEDILRDRFCLRFWLIVQGETKKLPGWRPLKSSELTYWWVAQYVLSQIKEEKNNG